MQNVNITTHHLALSFISKVTNIFAMQVQGFLKTTDCQIAGTVENM